MDSADVTFQLSDGTTVLVETRGAPEGFARDAPVDFGDVRKTIESVGRELVQTLEAIQPTKASVEFGVEISVEASGLTRLVAKGSASAHLTVTVEWERKQGP